MRFRLLFVVLVVLVAGCAPASRSERPVVMVRTVAVPSPAFPAADAAARSQLGAWLDGVHQAQLAAWYEAASRPRPVFTSARRQTSRTPSDSIEACIIARENGGDYGRSSNPTHFGAYQYDRQTWAANGGDPATWGSASPEEQDRVFRNTVNAHGYAPWRPYDGC